MFVKYFPVSKGLGLTGHFPGEKVLGGVESLRVYQPLLPVQPSELSSVDSSSLCTGRTQVEGGCVAVPRNVHLSLPSKGHMPSEPSITHKVSGSGGQGVSVLSPCLPHSDAQIFSF